MNSPRLLVTTRSARTGAWPAQPRGCRRMSWSWISALLALVAVTSSLGSASEPASAGASSAAAAAPLRYRRVFLSSEAIRRLESDALRNEAFVPVRREEFENLLGAVGTKSSAPQIASSPQIVQATYTALLNGELLAGSARLVIAPGADRGAVLSLNPCNLVLSQPRWEPAGSDEDPSDVEWGCDDSGRMVAMINAPGVLQFAWSRRGVRSAAGEFSFDLQLPTAAVNQLQLTLRRDLRPVTETAVVSRLDEHESTAEQTWRIELRGDMPLKVHLAPAAEPALAQPLILLRQEQRYTVTPDAVEITVRLRLDVYEKPLSELTLETDDAMQLYRVHYRDAPLEWSDAKAGAGRRVTLAMPEPLLGDGHEIRLQAVAAADAGTEWRLPRLTVPGVFWLEGVSRLDVPEPWRIANLKTEGGRQVQTVPLLTPQRGESVEIREFQPRSQITAVLQRAAGEMAAQTVTSVKLGTAATTVVYDAQLTSAGPPQHSVELNLLPGWTVDMVETQPPDALEDWRVVYGSVPSRFVQIHFRNPLAPDRPLHLTLYAHRRGVRPGERLRGRDLRLGTWRNASLSRSLLAVAAEASHQVTLWGDLGLRRLAAEDLSGWEKDRTQFAAGAVLYVEDPGAEELAVALLEEMPGYSAEIQIDSTYRENWVEQAFRLRCQPIASKVARLVVHFSEPMPAALRWTLDGEEEGTVLARPLDEGAETAGAPASGSVSWELILPRARDEAFELVAARTDAFAGSAAVPLVSLPSAASQIGYVTVRSATLPLTVELQNVRPIPAEQPPTGSYSTTRGAFRFDPSLDCRLTVRIAEGVSRCGTVWAAGGELRTWAMGNGRAVHAAVYRLENSGQTQIVVEPPKEAELLEILVNGRPVSWPRQASTRAGVAVNLPRGDRFPVLVVRYAAAFPRRGPLGTVTALWPDLGLPVFERDWVLWLPPGWQVDSAQAEAEADWTTRLFGPLLRAPQQPRFEPLSWSHWASSNAWTDFRGDGNAQQHGERILQMLAEEYLVLRTTAGDGPAPTWGGLLAGAQRRLDAAPGERSLPLLIDAASLARAGINGQTAVDLTASLTSPPSGDRSGSRAIARLGAVLLAKSHLALAVATGEIVVTTAETMALHADRVRENFETGLFLVRDGSALHGDVRHRRGVVPAGDWSAQSGEPPSWPIAGADVPNRGWTATGVAIPSVAGHRRTAGKTQVQVFHRDFFHAAGWAAFLANTGLMVWWTRRRPLWCLPLCAVWGGLALAVPAMWVPLAGGCFLGSLLSVVLVWLLPVVPRPRRPQAADSSGSSRAVLASATTGVLVFLLVVLAAASAAAQPSTLSAQAKADKVYRVLFPVDDQQQPMEPYVYVPHEFWNRLRREASGGGVVSRQWLIAAADYRVVFELGGVKPVPQARELTAQYRIRTEHAGVRLVLPIRQDQVYLLPNRARLDGRPASVAWESEGQVLMVEVPEPGEANLELAFRPQVELRDGLLRCDVQIPRVPNARLRLQLPADAPAVECLSALGNVTAEPAGERLISLGPAEHLTLQWPSDRALGAGAIPDEAEQLMWLRIRPGAAVLEARFRFASPTGRLQEIGVLASPRLRLLPHPEPDRIPVVSAEAGDNQRLRWMLKTPFAQEATLDLQFVLADVSGIGTVRLPRLEANATRTSRRWLGVSVDEPLRYETAGGGVGEPVDPLAFAAAWGAGTAPPQIAVAIPDGEPTWSLTTQPQPVIVQAAQQLDVSWGAERADLQFQSQLEVVGGEVFQYRLDVPSGLEIGSVSVREQDDVRAARWTRAGENVLIVRWDRAVTGKHQLEIRAGLPAPRSGEYALGRIAVQGVEVVSDAISLYRRAAVRVSVVDRAGLSDAPEPLEQYRPGWGRLVASLHAPPKQPRTVPLRVNIAPNRPRPRGTLVTILERQQDSWHVQIQYDLRVAGGLVDALRFEVPAEWSDSLSSDCLGELEVIAVPGQKRRHLILRPQQAIAASRRLTISGKLATPQGEAVQAPDIIPLDVDAADRYFCAPAKINQQGIAWKTSGLREISELPAGFEPPPGSHQIFIATQPRFRATIADVQPSSGLPRIVLADFVVNCDSGGNVAGTATFDLQPSGIDHCELELPEEYQLVHAAFGGLPAMLDSLEPQRWRLTFGPRQLAQQVQVVFHGRMQAAQPGSRRQTILVPRLAGIPIEQSLWTIRTTDAVPLAVFPAQNRVDPVKLECVRFASRAELIESGSEAVAAADPSVAARWYSVWFQHLAGSRSRIEQWSAAQPAVRVQYASELQEVEAVQAELNEKLRSLPQLVRANAASAMPPIEAWQRVRPSGELAALITRAGTVEVEFLPSAETVAEQRGAAAAVLIALAAVAWMLLPHPCLHQRAQFLLPLAGVVLGGVWWSWCSPSVLGPIVASMSLLLALRRLLARLVSSAAAPSETVADA